MVPVLVDGLTGLFVVVLLDTAVSRFSQKSVLNAIILIVAFILICAGVLIVRKLAVRDAGGKLTVPLLLLNRKLHILSAIVFAFIFVLIVVVQLGYFATSFSTAEAVPLTWSEESALGLLLLTSLGLLALSFVYFVVLLWKMTPAIAVENGRYPWLASLALLLINLMLLLTTVQFAAWINRQGLTGDAFLGAIVFGLLALIFGPPRWIYLSKQPDIGGDLSSLALWGLCAWLTIA